jgi:hypothetical protein
VKLRLDGNSIRLRLSPSEVSRLANTGEVSTRTVFPGGTVLTTSVQSDEVPGLTATFDGSKVLLSIPAGEVRRWAESEQIGIYGDAQGLRIIVEKDLRDSCK